MISSLMRPPISLESRHSRYATCDIAVEQKPTNLFQKLISGRYLGEILRLIICEMIDEGVLFLGQNTYKIEIPYSFDTAFLSLMER